MPASNAFAALILIGYRGGVMPRSTTLERKDIPFSARFWRDFFVGACCRFSFTTVFWFLFKMLSSSQNPDLDKDQLNGIEIEAQAKNSKRTTEWGVNKFEK